MSAQDVQVLFRSTFTYRLGSLCIQEQVTQYDIPRAPDRFRKDCVVVAQALQLAKFSGHPGRSLLLELAQCFHRRILLRHRKISVEGDDLCSTLRQLIDHFRVCIARNRESPDPLQSVLFETNNHDVLIVRTWSAQHKPRVERAQLDIVQEAETGMMALAQVAVREKDQRNGRNQEGDQKVRALDGKPRTQPHNPGKTSGQASHRQTHCTRPADSEM